MFGFRDGETSETVTRKRGYSEKALSADQLAIDLADTPPPLIYADRMNADNESA